MKSFLLVLALIWAPLTLLEAAPQIDEALAQKAMVVIRAKRTGEVGDSKYTWYEVVILKVLKNDSGEELGKTLKIAAYSWMPGVPDGEATLYLERYNPEKKGLWKLVGGQASTGVSHSSK